MIPHRPDLKRPAFLPSGDGEWHIINRDTRKSLESWQTEYQAEHFCAVVNEHEERNGRPTRYVVERRRRP